MSNEGWQDYTGQGTLTVGEYQWRLPHARHEGVIVIFHAKVHLRGDGYQPKTTSPAFDNWDGYRISVPASLQFRDARSEESAGYVEGATPSACLHCGKVPIVTTGAAMGVPSRAYRCTSYKIQCCISTAGGGSLNRALYHWANGHREEQPHVR